jgi:hypothetical protein
VRGEEVIFALEEHDGGIGGFPSVEIMLVLIVDIDRVAEGTVFHGRAFLNQVV